MSIPVTDQVRAPEPAEHAKQGPAEHAQEGPEVDENIEPELVEPSASEGPEVDENIAGPEVDENSEPENMTIQALRDELRWMRTRGIETLIEDECYEPELPDFKQRFEDIEWQIWDFYMRRAFFNDLQRWCSDCGLSTEGNKGDLIDRLTLDYLVSLSRCQ